MRPAFAAAALALLPSWAGAHDFTLGALTIAHPYAIATPATARAGAGYLAVTNTGDEADSLVAVRADFPQIMLHTTEVDASGVARMTELGAVEIPPGETVTLAPRGMHVMFIGLSDPFVEGEKIPATLVFEHAGEIAVEFDVEARGATGGGTDHGGMDHGAPAE
jgi:periplasmic copper chaperone A